MEDEKIKGYIPKVGIKEGIKENYYAMFITSKRIAFIHTGKVNVLAGAALGGALGAYFARDLAKDNYDFGNADIDSLIAQNRLNKVIPLERLSEVSLNKSFGDIYMITLFGFNQKNKIVRLINGYLAPPKADLIENLRRGYKEREIFKQYAFHCQKIIEQFLGDKLSQKYFI